jgi:hypothetical protein
MLGLIQIVIPFHRPVLVSVVVLIGWLLQARCGGNEYSVSLTVNKATPTATLAISNSQNYGIGQAATVTFSTRSSFQQQEELSNWPWGI